MHGDPEWRVRLAARDALSSMEHTDTLEAPDQFQAADGLAGTAFWDMNTLHAYAFENRNWQTRVHSGSETGRL
jgi:hypothetical protein